MAKLFAGIIVFIVSLFGVKTATPVIIPASTPTPSVVVASTTIPTRKPTRIPTIIPTSKPTSNPTPTATITPPQRIFIPTNQDNIAPAIDFAGPGWEPVNYQTGHVCYGITALDSVTPKERILYRYKMDNNALTDWLGWEIISQGICFNGLTVGNHTFYMEAKDEAGNIGSRSLIQEIYAVLQAN